MKDNVKIYSRRSALKHLNGKTGEIFDVIEDKKGRNLYVVSVDGNNYNLFAHEFHAIIKSIPKRVSIVELKLHKTDKSLLFWDDMDSPENVYRMVKPVVENEHREIIMVISVNAKSVPLAVEIVAIGGTSLASFDAKNMFKHAIISNATGIIMVHNHVSGDVKPSNEDFLVTARISECGKLLDVPVIDHIITGENTFFSFRQNGHL